MRLLGELTDTMKPIPSSYVGINIYGQKDQKIFESGVEYFK